MIEAVGAAVTDSQIGEHVAYMYAGIGAYDNYRNVASGRLGKIPVSIGRLFSATPVPFAARHGGNHIACPDGYGGLSCPAYNQLNKN